MIIPSLPARMEKSMSAAPTFQTVFASLDHYVKGKVEIVDGSPKHYALSNIFDVAARSKPYEKVVVAMNLGYVIETLRAEGTSDWYAASHDEFAVVMDGEVDVELVKLDDPERIAPADKQGSVRVNGAPKGRKMGRIECKRGHQALLPKGAAYRFRARKPGVLLLQTVLGELSVQKWAEICAK
jgi:hypothetical protein